MIIDDPIGFQKKIHFNFHLFKFYLMNKDIIGSTPVIPYDDLAARKVRMVQPQLLEGSYANALPMKSPSMRMIGLSFLRINR